MLTVVVQWNLDLRTLLLSYELLFWWIYILLFPFLIHQKDASGEKLKKESKFSNPSSR
jgi:hypothetical protein